MAKCGKKKAIYDPRGVINIWIPRLNAEAHEIDLKKLDTLVKKVQTLIGDADDLRAIKDKDESEAMLRLANSVDHLQESIDRFDTEIKIYWEAMKATWPYMKW